MFLNQKYGAAILALLMSCGCSVMKKFDSMKKTTESMENKLSKMGETTNAMAQTTAQMAGTTSQMAGTTDGMAGLTGHLDNTSSTMYERLRQANSKDIRNQSIAKMEKAESMEGKFVEAGVYMMSFEYQLWDAKFDTEEKRQVLYKEAIMELMDTLGNYIKPGMPIDISTNKAELQNLMAFSAGLHKINSNQTANAEKYGYEAYSVLDLLQQALVMNQKLKSGEIISAEIPEWAEEVLKFEDRAVYLLELRYNFLMAMPIPKISGLDDKKAFVATFKKIGLLLFKWTADFSGMNLFELKYEVQKVENGIKARDFLSSVGVNARTDSKLYKIYSHMRMTRDPGRSAGREGPELIQKFSNTIQNLLSH
jgi:hypothetical protein